MEVKEVVTSPPSTRVASRQEANSLLTLIERETSVSITNSEEAVNGSVNVNVDPTVPAPMINVAEYGFEGRFEDWADDARYFEYSRAANPIGSGVTPKVPVVRFSPEIYMDEPTGIVPLDLSKELGIKTGEATSPGLLANFVRIHAGEQIDTAVNATSQLYYVLYGRGFAAVDGRLVRWEKGDFLTLPAGCRAVFYADSGAALYWCRRAAAALPRAPTPTQPKFGRRNSVAPTRWPSSRRSLTAPGANDKSRVSVLLANAEEEQTLTITHVLWAMFGARPSGAAAAHVGGAGSDPRCPARLLHPPRHPRRRWEDHRPDSGGLGGWRRVCSRRGCGTRTSTSRARRRT